MLRDFSHKILAADFSYSADVIYGSAVRQSQLVVPGCADSIPVICLRAQLDPRVSHNAASTFPQEKNMTEIKTIPRATTTRNPDGKFYFSSKPAPWQLAFPEAGDFSFEMWVRLVCPKALSLSAPAAWIARRSAA